ncbi:Galactokinase [Mycena filopes]|nr:Galactokinase [Mycena filopes]
MSAQEAIPVYTNLKDLYASLGTSLNHAERWANLAAEFETRFGKKPTYIARAPGRVNLIGEHIDYALFGVLPAAVERDILIACAPRAVPSSSSAAEEPHHAPGSVIAENLHPKYTRQIFAPALKAKPNADADADAVHVEGWHLEIPQELRWENYVKAGYYGVLEEHFTGAVEHPIPVDLLVTGSVPAGSGLSSSAAMVVASTLAFLAINGKLEGAEKVEKGTLVKMSMENEKRVGVNSGGMDQAASILSVSSSVLYITFYPALTASPTPLPGGAVLVCAHSLVVADKALTAARNYNLRVVETLVGARVLARSLGLSVGAREKITFREVVGRLVGEDDAKGMDATALMAALRPVEGALDALKPPNCTEPEFGATLAEMVELSGLEAGAFHEVYMSWVEVDATHFKLYKRAKHVLSEALRVLQFRQLCLDAAANANGSDNNETVLKQLGALMNDSQTSCAADFECSCEELDLLTRLAREAGAYGSRLTGAGWGGCTVSLVPEHEVDAFIQKLSAAYAPYRGIEGEALGEVIFATRPSSGACVYKFE